MLLTRTPVVIKTTDTPITSSWTVIEFDWSLVKIMQVEVKIGNKKFTSRQVAREELAELTEVAEASVPNDVDTIVIDLGRNIFIAPLVGNKLGIAASRNVTFNDLKIINVAYTLQYTDLAAAYMDGIAEGSIPEPTATNPKIYLTLEYTPD